MSDDPRTAADLANAPPAALAPSRLGPMAIAMMVGLCLIWGGNQTAIKIASEELAPVYQAALRSLGSGTLVILWCLYRRQPFLVFDRTWIWGLLIGLLFSAEFIALNIGLNLTEVSRGVIYIYVAPFVAAIGAHFLAVGERLNVRRGAGLLLAFGGILLIFAKGLEAPKPEQIVGDLLCLTMGVLWGIDMLLFKLSPLSRISAERGLFYELAISSLVLLAVSALIGEPWTFGWGIRTTAAMAYSIVLVSFVSYITMIVMLRRYQASSLGAFVFLAPAFGVGIATIMLAEHPGWEVLAAVALTGAGIYLVNRN